MTERKPTPTAQAREIERNALDHLRGEINRRPYGYKTKLAKRLGWNESRLHRVLTSASPALGQVMAVAIAAGVPLAQLLQAGGLH